MAPSGAAPMVTARATRSGKSMAHSSTCMPPIEAPMTSLSLRMPSEEMSFPCAQTMSRTLMSGKVGP